MTEVYLIRHTQAEGNCYRMMQGFWDGAVTSLGFQEIAALGKRFSDIHVDAVYSSDLTRAVETAEGIARPRHLPVYTDSRLRELNMGPWEMQFFGNLSYHFPEKIDLFLHDPGSWKVDGAETLYDVIDRAYPALCEIAERHDDETIAVVSHGMTIRCLLTRILGTGFSGANLLPIHKNTAISKLIYKNGVFSVEYMNDAAHITPLVTNEWHSVAAMRDEIFDPSEDPAFYQSCYTDAWSFAHHGNMDGFHPDHYYKSARTHHADHPGAVKKLFLDDACIGLIDCNTEEGSHAGYGWISLLYLMPEYRGKGYGVQALGRAISLYTELGRGSIRLVASSSNTSALRFYKKNGFSVISQRTWPRENLFVLEKKIGGKKRVR